MRAACHYNTIGWDAGARQHLQQAGQVRLVLTDARAEVHRLTEGRCVRACHSG